MGRVGPGDEACASNSVGNLLSRLVDRLEIERPHENQGWHPDLREPVKRGWVELPFLDVVPVGRHLEGSPLHQSNQVPDCGVNITGVSAATVDPAREIRLYGSVQVIARQRGGLGLDERAQVRRELRYE